MLQEWSSDLSMSMCRRPCRTVTYRGASASCCRTFVERAIMACSCMSLQVHHRLAAAPWFPPPVVFDARLCVAVRKRCSSMGASTCTGVMDSRLMLAECSALFDRRPGRLAARQCSVGSQNAGRTMPRFCPSNGSGGCRGMQAVHLQLGPSAQRVVQDNERPRVGRAGLFSSHAPPVELVVATSSNTALTAYLWALA